MQVSAKLADEVFIIEAWHLFSLLVSFGFNWFISHKAKKGALLSCYLLAQGSLALWMLAKIGKTVASTLDLRWFFVVLQYFASSFLGPLVLLFAMVYRFHRLPSRRRIFWLLLPGMISFLLVWSNPWHFMFYSRFTLYADDFGPLFYGVMSVTYAYLAVAFYWLSRDYSSLFQHRRTQAILFTGAILLPLVVNLFYVFGWFKMLLHHTPRFDYTPIATNASLLLFAMAALRTRFLDVLPLAQEQLFERHGDACFVCDEQGTVLHRNERAREVFLGLPFIEWIPGSTVQVGSDWFEVEKSTVPAGALWRLRPVTTIRRMRQLLEEQNRLLQEANAGWQRMLQRRQEWIAWKARQKVLQELHDVLGHTVVLALSTAEVALLQDTTFSEALSKVKELLIQGRTDWQSSLQIENKQDQTSLQMALHSIRNGAAHSGIAVDLLVQGDPYELRSEETRLLYRLLQEALTNAIKHSKATRMDVVLRYLPRQVQLIILDNGQGCENLQKGHGLLGMEERVSALGGTVKFTYGPGEGFRIDTLLKRRVESCDTP